MCFLPARVATTYWDGCDRMSSSAAVVESGRRALECNDLKAVDLRDEARCIVYESRPYFNIDNDLHHHLPIVAIFFFGGIELSHVQGDVNF